ncbi:MAG TPA: thioredoxin fold domain-containing protein [Salinimicrobium sp.]|nr:thioredoxin fold domain-containing protein [Salinimicrobium sp.]
MKTKILVILFLSFVSLTNAQKINWMTMNEALAAQKENPKKIFMDVYTKWCGPCKLMDRNTFQNEDVVEYINEHYYAVKFDAEGTEEVFYKDFNYTNPNYDPNRRGRNSQHFFANALRINAYPTVVFFDEQGNIIAPVAGYRTPSQLEIYLKMIKEDHYKQLTTQEAWAKYEANFKGKFKDN